MKRLHLLQASIVVVGVIALVATAPGCGNERRERTVVVRDYHDRGRHGNRKVIFERDRSPRWGNDKVHAGRDRDHHRH